jgi:MraZ protein
VFEAFLKGEHRRVLDARFRLSIPADLAQPLTRAGGACILVKEQPGALSLWSAAEWKQQLNRGLQLIQGKLEAGRFEGRIHEVQQLGRLLSTRHTDVHLADRHRLVLPTGFREFLGVEPGGETLVIGAALCVEIWRPSAWLEHLERAMPEFHRLFDGLSR